LLVAPIATSASASNPPVVLLMLLAPCAVTDATPVFELTQPTQTRAPAAFVLACVAGSASNVPVVAVELALSCPKSSVWTFCAQPSAEPQLILIALA
jgi:hypothetical protein